MEAFNEQQKQVYHALLSGDNAFMTGPGGSGKSYLIKHIVQALKERGKKVQVCALTGAAAVLLECGAKTIHSWAGIGLGQDEPDIIARRIQDNKYKKKPWKQVDVLIIDEVSMLSEHLFEVLDAVGRQCRHKNKRELPFGGIQLLFSGDFFQLPPVGTTGKPKTGAFCFESPLWDTCFPVQIQLNQVYRQNDLKFQKVLRQIRIGRISPSTLVVMKECTQKKFDSNNDIVPTKLYPTRRKVDAINQAAMDALGDCDEQIYKIENHIDEEKKSSKGVMATMAVVTQQQINFESNYLRDTINCENNIRLKVGAQVMCTANISVDGQFPVCNGSRGVVIRFEKDTGYPVVRFVSGFTRTISPHTWMSETYKWIGVKQVPLMLAWAITIHKSQGASLDVAEIDVGSGVFECGQTYVALSRIRSLEGLYVKSFDASKIKVNKKVLKYYDDLCMRAV
jgi:ATP-dependent DNA helicase PIF1